MLNRILGWSRAAKRMVVVAMDICLGVIAMWLAFTLRLETPHWPSGMQWLAYALAPALAFPIFAKLGLYRAIFRYTGITALITTGKAVAIYGALLLGCLLAAQWEGVPRTGLAGAGRAQQPCAVPPADLRRWQCGRTDGCGAGQHAPVPAQRVCGRRCKQDRAQHQRRACARLQRAARGGTPPWHHRRAAGAAQHHARATAADHRKPAGVARADPHAAGPVGPGQRPGDRHGLPGP